MTIRNVLSANSDGWFVSSYSNSSGGNCVEVKFNTELVLVRDSKDRDHGPMVGIPAGNWAEFVGFISK